MVSRRRRAKVAAYAAGALMIISGTTGSTVLWRLGAGLIAQLIPVLEGILFWLLLAVAILAGLGGFTVLVAGWMISKGWTTQAKVLITIGVGTGLLGLAGHLVLEVARGAHPVSAILHVGSTLSGLAVLLSIYARHQL